MSESSRGDEISRGSKRGRRARGRGSKARGSNKAPKVGRARGSHARRGRPSKVSGGKRSRVRGDDDSDDGSSKDESSSSSSIESFEPLPGIIMGSDPSATASGDSDEPESWREQSFHNLKHDNYQLVFPGKLRMRPRDSTVLPSEAHISERLPYYWESLQFRLSDEPKRLVIARRYATKDNPEIKFYREWGRASTNDHNEVISNEDIIDNFNIRPCIEILDNVPDKDAVTLIFPCRSLTTMQDLMDHAITEEKYLSNLLTIHLFRNSLRGLQQIHSRGITHYRPNFAHIELEYSDGNANQWSPDQWPTARLIGFSQAKFHNILQPNGTLIKGQNQRRDLRYLAAGFHSIVELLIHGRKRAERVEPLEEPDRELMKVIRLCGGRKKYNFKKFLNKDWWYDSKKDATLAPDPDPLPISYDIFNQEHEDTENQEDEATSDDTSSSDDSDAGSNGKSHNNGGPTRASGPVDLAYDEDADKGTIDSSEEEDNLKHAVAGVEQETVVTNKEIHEDSKKSDSKNKKKGPVLPAGPPALRDHVIKFTLFRSPSPSTSSVSGSENNSDDTISLTSDEDDPNAFLSREQAPSPADLGLLLRRFDNKLNRRDIRLPRWLAQFFDSEKRKYDNTVKQLLEQFRDVHDYRDLDQDTRDKLENVCRRYLPVPVIEDVSTAEHGEWEAEQNYLQDCVGRLVSDEKFMAKLEWMLRIHPDVGWSIGWNKPTTDWWDKLRAFQYFQHQLGRMIRDLCTRARTRGWSSFSDADLRDFQVWLEVLHDLRRRLQCHVNRRYKDERRKCFAMEPDDADVPSVEYLNTVLF